MHLQFFNDNADNPTVLIPAIIKEQRSFFDLKAYREYEPKLHKVNNPALRRDKRIMKPDPSGATNAQSDPVLIPETVLVARLAIAMQRLIVKRAVAFLTGGGVTLSCKPANAGEQALLDAVQATWDDNKLDYKNGQLARRFFSETECAEIWYSTVDDEGQPSMKCNIYSPSKGYELYPVFEDQGTMIAFAMQYEAAGPDGKKAKRMDIYTKDSLSRYQRSGRGWELLPAVAGTPNPVPLKYGKIPVIYYGTDRSIWDDVQTLIDRLETLLSNFSDTNDYNGSPILFAKGRINGFSSKGETGKVIESEGTDADLKYVAWEQAPEAIELEIETLMNLIYTMTQTPDISFQALKGLGDISGEALKRVMTDAYLAAAERQGDFYGEGIQRRINFLISACAATTADVPVAAAKTIRIKPKFMEFSISGLGETIDNMLKANGGKPLLSQKETIQRSGLSDDADATIEAIKKETPEPVSSDPKGEV